MIKKNKLAQEEMVGFAVIIIIVAVVLVVFLGFSLKNKQEKVESYEVDSFIQSLLQYTTGCKDNFEYRSVQDLIFDCSNKKTCSEGGDSCEILNSELKGILEESWKVEEETVAKGYELKIISNEKEMLSIEKGNITKNSKGASQEFFKTGNKVNIFFTIYT